MQTKSANTIIYWLFLFFVFLIPLSQYLSSGALVIIVFLALVPPGRGKVLSMMLNQSWDLILYFSVLAIGLLYSDDTNSGVRVIETSLSLLALPVIFGRLGEFGKDRVQHVFYAFVGGLGTASLICLANAVITYKQGGTTDVFFFYQFTAIVDSHPTYFAYYLISTIAFGLYLMYYEKLRVAPWLMVGALLFFLMVLMLTGGTTAFVSLLFVLAFFVLKFLLEEKTKKHVLTFALAILMVAGMFLFNEIRNLDPSGFVIDDSWERLVLWESALKANPSILLGVGTGDYKDVLNEYYTLHNLADYAESNLNAHNQFIETYFANGLLGLACLLLVLGRPIYLSVRNGNALGTLIFFPFIIYGMTEVFFGRYQGVVFFALMQECFLAYYQSYRPGFSMKRA